MTCAIFMSAPTLASPVIRMWTRTFCRRVIPRSFSSSTVNPLTSRNIGARTIPGTARAPWLTGQAAALREAAWHARVDSDPAADAQETALALAWLLAKITPAEPLLPQVNEPASADLEPLQKQSDELARRAATWNPNIDSLTAMMHSLAETDSEFVVSPERSAEALYYRARRVALALERLLAAINLNRAVPLKIEPELNALRQDVSSRGNFEPARFAEHLRALRGKL